MKANWRIIEEDSILVNELSAKMSLDSRLVRILANRGLKTVPEIYNFLNPHPSQILNPFLLTGVKDAITLIRAAISDNKRIGIFADSDLDGLTSLTLLLHVLGKQSDNIYYRYPKEDEDYGLTTGIIDEFNKENVGLIITVDSGVRDCVEISYARSLGMQVIVTDHHEPADELPNAVVVNPLRRDCSYPYKKLAGVGVAFKLCYGLLLSYLPSYNMTFFLLFEDEDSNYHGALIKDGMIASTEIYRTFAETESFISNMRENCQIVCNTSSLASKIQNVQSVCTINDLLPEQYSNFKNSSYLEIANHLKINCNNTVLKVFTDTFFELQRISSSKISTFLSYALSLVAIGTIADVMPLTEENRLLTACGLNELGHTTHYGLAKILNNKKVNAKTIGWELAPLLNSPGRFGKAYLTANFFIQNYHNDDGEVLNQLYEINKERKELVDASINGGGKETDKGKFIVAVYENIPDGMAGLIANRLMDKSNKPAIALIYPPKNGIIKGSGRAPKGFDFFSYIETTIDMLERAGGHAQAFGFTISQENVSAFINKLSELLENVHDEEPVINIDIEIQSTDVTLDFFKLLNQIEPFGKENDEPLFLMKDVKLNSFKRFGKENDHGKYIIDPELKLSAIGWNMADEMENLYRSGKHFDIVFSLEEDTYMGRSSIRLMLKDMG